MYVAPKPSGAAQLPQNRFEFQVVDDGPVYSVPKLAFVKPEIVAQISTATTEDAARAMFALFKEYAPKALASLEDSEQLAGIYQAWIEASGISTGESSGSGGSSPSTAEPSTEISSSLAAPSEPVPTTATSAPTV